MNKQKKDGDETVIEVGGKSYKVLTAVLASIGVICVIFSLSFTIIPTGYTGVRVTFGQVEQNTLPHGFNFHLPVIQQIVTMIGVGIGHPGRKLPRYLYGS